MPSLKDSSSGAAQAVLAWSLLVHRKAKLLISIAALALAVVVMFMQLGFYSGLSASQARLAKHFDGDLVVMDARREHFNRFTPIMRLHAAQLAAITGVAEAISIYNCGVDIKNPATRQYRRTYLLAWKPGTHPFRFAGLDEQAIEPMGAVLFDRRARDIYGPLEKGMSVDVHGKPHTLAGFFDFGPSFSNDGTLVTSEATLVKLLGVSNAVDWILVRLNSRDDLETIRRRILEVLPQGVSVLTPEEMRVREVAYTTRKAPVGIIFGIGLMVGFMIGTVICYQILYNEIDEHRGQFATLKAMGFPGKFLQRVVLIKAALLGCAGFLLGWAGGVILYRVIEQETGIIMVADAGQTSFIFVITLAMCLLAGWIAVRRVLRMDAIAAI